MQPLVILIEIGLTLATILNQQLPDYTKPYFNPFGESLPCLFYTENETFRLPSSKNVSQLNIAADLASKLTFLKINEDLTISRLKGELFVYQGKHYLSAEEHPEFSDMRPLVHWGKVDLNSLLFALEKSGVKGSIEKVNIEDGHASNVLHVFEPANALIQVQETSTVISTCDESLASLISDAVHSILNGV